jgi:DtxR family Mn-dependent transcriptional regulator
MLSAVNFDADAAVNNKMEGVQLSLAELSRDEEAEVLSISPACRGYLRQRLLDLGLTSGARVSVASENAFGDPRAYRIRGALIALRREQAGFVIVRPLAPTQLQASHEA